MNLKNAYPSCIFPLESGGMGHGNKLGAGHRLIVAVPGFVAFYWQIRDRRDRSLAERPYVRITALNPRHFSGSGDWLPIVIQIRNDTKIPLAVEQIEVIAPKQVHLAPTRISRVRADPTRRDQGGS